MKKYLISFFASVTSFFIFSICAYAEVGTSVNDAKVSVNNLAGLVKTINEQLVGAVGTLLLSAGVIVFFSGVVQYVWGIRAGDPAKIKTGNAFMKWALLALFVMFSVYGIIKAAQNFIGLKELDTIVIPSLNFKSSPVKGVPATGADPALPVSGPATGGIKDLSTGGRPDSTGCPSVVNECEDSSTCSSGQGCFAESRGICSRKVCKALSGYTCPNGKTYTDPQDRAGVCGSSGSAASVCSPGLDCRVSGGGAGTCNAAGTACVPDVIGGSCLSITSSIACSSSGCSWNEDEGTCR